MSGHVFHPGHEELHGITVIVDGASGCTYVGRYHESGPRGLVLHDVAILEVGSTLSRDEWLERQRRFGVEAKHRHLLIPPAETDRVIRLVPG